LSKVPVGRCGHVLRCGVSEEVKKFLSKYNVRVGIIITVVAAGENDILVQTNHELITLSNDIAEKISVALSQVDENFHYDREISEKASEKLDIEEYMQMDSDKANSIEQISLNTLKKGQHGIIVKVDGKGQVKRRMMDMGVVPGSEISVVRVAPFGDPIEFSIKGYRLSLRKSEAEKITVEQIDRK
ncbi:MAG: ferrous iron transport protein A, partial [Chloroflexota bacterium]|nr:ferrous iron transport protein A [Chloroflexota bacterium]